MFWCGFGCVLLLFYRPICMQASTIAQTIFVLPMVGAEQLNSSSEELVVLVQTSSRAASTSRP